MVPGKYLASVRDKELITILKNELDKKENTNAHALNCHRNHNKKTNLHFWTDILKT